MTSSEIYSLESSNKNEIHLLRAGNFFHAWNKSAYFFSKHFFDFEIHCRYVKKIGAEMLYLGFPNNSLEKVQQMALQKGMNWAQLDDNHFVIGSFVLFSGYEQWKTEKFKKVSVAESEESCKTKPRTSEKISLNMTYAYKEFFESCLYIMGRTSQMSRSMRSVFVDRLRGECLDLLDHLDFCQMGLDLFNAKYANRKFCQIRQKLRMLQCLKQISPRQWFFITEKLENVKRSLRLQSVNLRVDGECQPESSSLLAPEV